jgi:hypothetical protein
MLEDNTADMTSKALTTVTGMAVFVAALSSSLLAQWPNHPDASVPRLATGEVNLNAPAPRTADGKPDLSGLWQGENAGRAGGPPAEADAPPPAGFRDVGQNIKGGLPLTPMGQELLKARVANNSKDNPEAWCLPMGIVQFHTQGAPRKFVQTPKLLVILYEASSGIRQVFLDGRKAPTGDPQPWYYGYSTGRWEGDTLVVETTHMREDGWLDIIGSPLTDAATLTERIRRPTYGRMTIDVTVNDPKAYTKPWTVRVNQRIMPEQEIIEFICEENQRFGKQ